MKENLDSLMGCVLGLWQVSHPLLNCRWYSTVLEDIVLWSVSPGHSSLNCLIPGSANLGKYLSLIFSSLKWEL